MRARPSQATIAATVLALTLAVGTSARAWMSPDPHQADDGKLAISAGGAMSIEDSRSEAAILTAPALAPGHAAAGTVTIRNHGAAGYLTLARRDTVATPAVGGSSLAEALRLRIHEVGAPSRAFVYSGLLATMPPLRLGPVAPAAKRRYRFVAHLPDPGSVDNALMGARIRLDYRWALRPRP